MVETDEVVTGWNGALSDQGTGRTYWQCEECGKIVEAS